MTKIASYTYIAMAQVLVYFIILAIIISVLSIGSMVNVIPVILQKLGVGETNIDTSGCTTPVTDTSPCTIPDATITFP